MGVSFRQYLQLLREHNEITEIMKPVDPRNIAALVAQSETTLHFSNVDGYSMPVVSGLLQSRNRLALAMGVSYEKIEEKLRAAMDHPVPPRGAKESARQRSRAHRERGRSLSAPRSHFLASGRRSDDHGRRRHRGRSGIRHERRHVPADAQREKHHRDRHRHA
jgi:UbiD family decarboxylase